MFILGLSSKAKLNTVHKDLQKVVELAITLTEVDFTVTEGIRTVDRQKTLVAKGASKTMNSRHITGHAVDLAALIDGQVAWDWPLYHKIADAMKKAAKQLDIPIVWGGDWTKGFRDGPHFELSRKSYP